MKRVPLFELLLLACLILLPQSAYADALNDEQVAIAAERNGDKDSALKLYQSAFDGYSDDEQFAEAARVAQSLMLLQISLGMIGEAVGGKSFAVPCFVISILPSSAWSRAHEPGMPPVARISALFWKSNR